MRASSKRISDHVKANQAAEVAELERVVGTETPNKVEIINPPDAIDVFIKSTEVVVDAPKKLTWRERRKVKKAKKKAQKAKKKALKAGKRAIKRKLKAEKKKKKMERKKK